MTFEIPSRNSGWSSTHSTRICVRLFIERPRRFAGDHRTVDRPPGRGQQYLGAHSRATRYAQHAAEPLRPLAHDRQPEMVGATARRALGDETSTIVANRQAKAVAEVLEA